MKTKQEIQLFESKKVRTAWDSKLAREQLESKTGKSAISADKAVDYLLPTEDK